MSSSSWSDKCSALAHTGDNAYATDMFEHDLYDWRGLAAGSGACLFQQGGSCWSSHTYGSLVRAPCADVMNKEDTQAEAAHCRCWQKHRNFGLRLQDQLRAELCYIAISGLPVAALIALCTV